MNSLFNSQDLIIRLAQPSELYALRHQVLRPGKPVSDCHWSADDEPKTFHVGAFHNKKTISIATFASEGHKELPAQNPFRLRGMATDPEWSGTGAGKKVLQFGFNELRQTNCDLLWCNARVVAFGFYEKLGLDYHGPQFELPDSGPHKVMWIRL